MNAFVPIALAITFVFAATAALAQTPPASSSRPSAQSSPVVKPTQSQTMTPNDWEAFMISTDRNSVTPHPNVVPRGVLQFENGATMEKFHRGGSYTLPETSIRLGVLKWTELRFSTPNYIHARGTERVEGTSDTTVGLKQELEPQKWRDKGFDLGVIAGMSLPTGSRLLTSRRVDPFVQPVMYQKIGRNWIIGTAQSIFLPTIALAGHDFTPARRVRNVVYQPTCIVYRALGPRIDLWGEYAANFAHRGNNEQILDGGILWRPGNKHQLDFRFGFGLNNPAPRAFIGMGYSFIAGRLFNR